jgi:hypothetical protein
MKIKNPFGAFIISGGGRVDTPLFLKSYRRFLQQNDLLKEESYTQEAALSAKTKVIFCDGFRSAGAGLSATLPWQVVKGRVSAGEDKGFLYRQDDQRRYDSVSRGGARHILCRRYLSVAL